MQRSPVTDSGQSPLENVRKYVDRPDAGYRESTETQIKTFKLHLNRARNKQTIPVRMKICLHSRIERDERIAPRRC